LIAQAGYEYRQLADNRRVLTRISTSESAVHEKVMLIDVLSPLVDILNNFVCSLKNTLTGTDIVSKLLDHVIDLLIKIGSFLSDMLTKPKPS
jgi:hypothetical protein